MTRSRSDLVLYIQDGQKRNWKHEVADCDEYRKVARKWRLAVRTRSRWIGKSANHVDALIEDLKSGMNIGQGQLKLFGQSGLVEIVIPDPNSDAGRLARLFPWEYALSTATRPFRHKSRRLSVIRSLKEPSALPNHTVRRILYIECVPHELEGIYSFEHERYLVGWYAAGVLPNKEGVYDQPSEELEIRYLTGSMVTERGILQVVKEFEPDIIHLSGFDILEANQVMPPNMGSMLGGSRGSSSPRNRDGVYVRQGALLKPLYKEALARCLTCAVRKPNLICLNIYNSSSRLGPALIQAGAGSVVAFYGSFDDSLAELFFECFYKRFRANGFGDVLNTFDATYRGLSVDRGYLRGSAVVLWTKKPLLHAKAWPKARRGLKQQSEPQDEIQSIEDAKRLVKTEIRPIRDLNYSMLHNPMLGRGQLFTYFRLINHCTRNLRVFVEVELHVGRDNFPYRQVFEVNKHSFREVTEKISVPLTSELARQIRESVRTSLHIRVSVLYQPAEYTIYEHTYAITLLPVNQWQDDDENMVWLPSFVLPRDPWVPKIMGLSRKHLQTITDDPLAAFDGYQQVNGTVSTTDQDMIDGDGKLIAETVVDDQVRAIWCALLYEFDLGYTNPPPSYTFRSQRLRTPSQVVEGKLGTCIDLALLIAACLEYIDIKPTIFLFRGHACVGYWAAPSVQNDYAAAIGYVPPEDVFKTIGSDVYEMPEMNILPHHIDAAWIAKNYAEIRQYVNEGALRALETTCIPDRCGFFDAVESGFDLLTNLRKRKDFECMIDISLARTRGITPLPLLGKEV